MGYSFRHSPSATWPPAKSRKALPMIIIAGTFDFEPAGREAFLEATAEVVGASNAIEVPR